jgi:hypothetical protein
MDAASGFAGGRLTWTVIGASHSLGDDELAAAGRQSVAMPAASVCAHGAPCKGATPSRGWAPLGWEGHGRARGPVGTGGCPADPAWDGQAGSPPAADRRAAATAASPADQRGKMADRRGHADSADDRGLRRRAARPRRQRHRRRRGGGQVAGQARPPGAGGGVAGAGGPQLLVGHQRVVGGAGGGAAGAQALPASDRGLGRRAAGDHARRERGGSNRAAPTAVRGGHPGRLGWLGAAVIAARLPRDRPGGSAVYAGPGGSLARPG